MSDKQVITASRPWWFWPTAIVGTTLFLVGLVWGPWWLEGQHLRDKNGELAPSAGVIVTGFRTMLVAIAAGVLTAVGLWYTHRNFEHTRDKDREQTVLTREGQVTGRYVEAIKLLASERLHERLGGIYALERIMKDSDRDHRTIVEVLSAFARTKLQEAESKRQIGKDPAATGRAATSGREVSAERHLLAEDVKAALTVLARRDTTQTENVPAEISDAPLAQHDLVGTKWRSMTLERVNFADSHLKEAHLDYANLDGADLDRATLAKASLRNVSLSGARLEGADLVSANLTNACLKAAHMPRAIMNKAVLSGANLLNANLDGTSLNQAILEGATMKRAKLRGARLRQANLKGANLEFAALSHANMHGAELSGARLKWADLDNTDLRGAKLDKALGLDVSQLLKARVNGTTTLPSDLADNPEVQKHIEEMEEMESDEQEAEVDARMAYEASLAEGIETRRTSEG
ncbi:pentapeptide repeat-containing protein [Streptomyces sp. NPDC048564]|uniref:pentapeptide repeat-containing protein n=1 Tax=Streptomyces sp. NPDC048564 TaxID=3155760 RepID=UPI00342C8E6E